jgi:uracil-DNA glycosylase
MDGRDQLRRYLEQRKEAGERELVLDQLDVDDVLKLVGASPKKSTTDKRTATEVTPSTPGSAHASADWREVLRSSGVEPGGATRDAGSTPQQTERASTPPAHPAALPATEAPPGLSVGGADRELFRGPLGDLESLDAVARSVAACTRCPLYSTATNPVPGEGNPDADLMIVGEAPGANEDQTGRPFIGAAGQLLTKILAAVDLNREDVFICNVLKHRPPGNRNPMPDEVTACSPYLMRQFELIRPKAILALGTFAAQTLLQTKLAIGKLRGQVHRFHGVPLIVTYHPAALLRNPSWKRPTWEDVQLVRRILDSSVDKS